MKKILIILAILGSLMAFTACTASSEELQTPAKTTEENEQDSMPIETVDISLDIVGPWHLSEEENNLSVISSLFPGMDEIRGSMEICSDGHLSWHIGQTNGVGTYDIEEDVIHAVLTENESEKEICRDFIVVSNDKVTELLMEYEGKTIYWVYGDQLDEQLSSDYPGEDVVELIDRKGDTITVYKLADGRYMDRVGMVYVFDGNETWTNENGAEWNMTLKDSN